MTIKLSIIHFDVIHKEPEQNKAALFKLLEQAAKQGADIIMTPEMALSGYSFKSRQDISDYVEDDNGSFLLEITTMAQSYKCYICIGLATRDPLTKTYHNTALVAGPTGVVCRYRKINAENRWACPGDPKQNNIFETPWGKVGILICSDTYHELMPRVIALKGADLLLVLANWPPSGLDPLEIWQARAMENGMMIAACNRTGQDLNMDCRESESCLIDSDGTIHSRCSSPDSEILNVVIPLVKGQLDNSARLKQLAERQPEHYHDCYRNLAGINDITSFLTLPEPGNLTIHCLVQEPTEELLDRLKVNLTKMPIKSTPSLLLLPSIDYSAEQLQSLANLACEYKLWLLTLRSDTNAYYLFNPNGESQQWKLSSHPMVNIGPAKSIIMPFATLRHPESAVAASKQGCDLIICLEEQYTTEMKLLSGARTINHLAVAVCTTNGAGIWMRPEGHQRWQEEQAETGQSCSFNLNTTLTRQKRFQDRIDFDQLLLRTTISRPNATG